MKLFQPPTQPLQCLYCAVGYRQPLTAIELSPAPSLFISNTCATNCNKTSLNQSVINYHYKLVTAFSDFQHL